MISDHIIVITRAAHQSAEFARKLQERGFKTIQLPSIEIEAAQPNEQLKTATAKLIEGFYKWLIFSSSNAVDCLYSLQKQQFANLSDQDLINAYCKIAAQGSTTAQHVFSRYHRRCDFMPHKFVAESFVEEFDFTGIKEARVLIALAEDTRGVITQAMKDNGALVEELVVYRTKHSRIPPLLLSEIDRIEPAKLVFTFFSPSAVNSTQQAMQGREDILRSAKLVSIGPVTSKAIRDAGLNIEFEARDHSESGVLLELSEWFSDGN